MANVKSKKAQRKAKQNFKKQQDNKDEKFGKKGASAKGGVKKTTPVKTKQEERQQATKKASTNLKSNVNKVKTAVTQKTDKKPTASHFGQVTDKTQVNKKTLSAKGSTGYVGKKVTDTVKQMKPYKGDTVVGAVQSVTRKEGESYGDYIARKNEVAQNYNANGTLRQETKTKTGYTDKDRKTIAEDTEDSINKSLNNKYTRVKAFRDSWKEEGGLGDQFKEMYGREATAEEKKSYYKNYWKPDYQESVKKLAESEGKKTAEEVAPDTLYSKELSKNEAMASAYYSKYVGNKKFGKNDTDTLANKAIESLGMEKYTLKDLGTKKADGTKVTKADLGKVKTSKNGNIKYQKVEKRDQFGNVVKDKNGKPVMVNRDVAEEYGSQSMTTANKSKFFTGFMQGAGVNNVLQSGVGRYNNAAKKVMENVTDSGAFNAGYMTGVGAQFLGGGVNAVADGLISGVTKKGVAKSVGKLALQKGATDAAMEAPLNVLDAYKMATDSDGNVNKLAFGGYFLANSLMSGGAGAVLGAGGHAIVKDQASKFIKLQSKLQTQGLSAAEKKEYIALGKKMMDAQKGDVLSKAGVADEALGPATTMHNFNTDSTVAKVINTTNRRTNGNINIIAMTPEEMEKSFGKVADGVTLTQDGKKVIYLNNSLDRTRELGVTLGHELTHHVADADQTFIKELEEYAGDNFTKKFAELEKDYRDIPDANVTEETACDLMGEYIRKDSGFFAYLGGKDKTAFDKMYDYVKGIMSKDKEIAGDKEFKALKQKFDDVIEAQADIESKANSRNKWAIPYSDLPASIKKTVSKKAIKLPKDEQNYVNVLAFKNESRQKNPNGYGLNYVYSDSKFYVYVTSGYENYGVDVLKAYDIIGNESKIRRLENELSPLRKNISRTVDDTRDGRQANNNAVADTGNRGRKTRTLRLDGQTQTGYAGRDIGTGNIGNEKLTPTRTAPKYAATKPTEDVGSFNAKKQQAEIISKTNPRDDALGDHTWIKSEKDIKTFGEALNDESFTPDYTKEMANGALKSGEIKVYSSKPIEDGVFVTPSKMEAQNYAGDGKVYEATLKTKDVAWIDSLEGQVAKVNTPRFAAMKTNSKEYKAKVDEIAEAVAKGEDFNTLTENVQKFVRDNAKIDREITENIGTNLDALREAKKYMRETGITIRTTAATEGKTVNQLLENVGFDKKSIGSKLKIRQNGGKTIEKAYHDLQEIDAERFPDLDNEEDMLRKMIEASQENIHGEKQTYTLTDADVEDIINNESADLMEKAYAKAKGLKAEKTEPVKPTPDDVFEGAGETRTPAERVKAENRDYVEMYDTEAKKPSYRAEAERIMREHPEIGQNAAKQNVLYYDAEKLDEGFWDSVDNGFMKKSAKVTQEQAREEVKTLEKNTSLNDMANQFLGMDYMSDPHKFGAMAENILPRLQKEWKTGPTTDNLELMLKVSDHANEIVSHGASITNAAKMWVNLTPMGKVSAMEKSIARLNGEYGDRLKTPLALTDDQKAMLMRAESPDEVTNAVATIMRQVWDNIPSTFWEKLNTMRHISMLLNGRTNARNITGNAAFLGVRTMSDAVEYLVSKSMKNTLEKAGSDAIRATSAMVTAEERKASTNFIKAEFDAHYNSNTNKYKDGVDMSRPAGKTVLESKVGSSLENFTYYCLEKGDMAFFKPEYIKSYRRYCKNQGVDLKNLDMMTDIEKSRANTYAMSMAEKATFRETTKASEMLTKLKVKTATKKGKTVAGTVGYRAANAALESAIPFVKTPINVFRQSVDYSPAGLVKSINEMLTFKIRGDVEMLENAIHHFATGLTGSGVAVAGYLLAQHGLVMVKAGEKSGDAYYDRDMGYQDYSLTIGNKSYTIDWASPMQAGLFMGAQISRMSDLTGMDSNQVLNALSSLVMPHLESSFMSGTADTLNMFMETAYSKGKKTGVNEKNGSNTYGGADWGGAIIKTVFGTVPQNYISSMLPFSQVSSQLAGLSDKYQRDTSSTAEDNFVNSWQSFGRKMQNKIPFVRELLNPKLNRRGENVKSGSDNIAVKFFNSMLNPTTVKEITFDKTDRELIKIYRDMPDGDDKKYFFYNFTGKPSYDLEGDKEGQRMTYGEAYKYLKTSRREQNSIIQDMLNAKSYKNMNAEMKADEVNSSYWISRSVADMKTYDAKYACSTLNRDTDKDAWAAMKSYGGTAERFMDFYIKKEKLVARTHDTSSSSYNTKALAVALYGNKKLETAYDIRESKMELANAYLKAGGNEKEYSNAMCNVISRIKKACTDEQKISESYSNKAVSAAYNKINSRTYSAMGIKSQKANMGYWFKNNKDQNGNKYTLKSLTALKHKGELKYRLDTKAGVTDFIESLGIKDTVEKACLFEYLDQHNSNNPYGDIPNYLNVTDTDSSSGSGRRRRGGGSGGSGGSNKSKAIATHDSKMKLTVSNPFGGSNASSKSNLTDAYRKKLQKLIKS